VSSLGAGDRAPAYRLPQVGGGTLSGPEVGVLTCLVVVKSTCPTCVWALPFFQTLHARTAGGSLRVVAITEDTAEVAAALVAELGITFPVGIEGDPWPVSAAYDLSAVPTFFLVGRDGRIELTSVGFARDDLHAIARRAAEEDGGEPADPFEGQEVPVYRPG
jgi:peroxiredoxin